MINKKEPIDELYLVRTLAIIGVIMVHSTSFIVLNLNQSSTYWPLYNFLNIFFKFGTPTFIFLSSIVLFYNYFDRPIDKKLIRTFYSRRMLYIILPYLLFSVLYSILLIVNNSWLNWSYLYTDVPQRILEGRAYTHLYFVYISIQFYILFPLFLYICQKSRWVTRNLIWLGILIQWGFVLYNHYYLGYTRTGSLSIWYFSYYFIGAYIGIYYKDVVGWLKVKRENLLTKKALFWFPLWGLWIASALAHVYLWYIVRTASAVVDTKIYTLLWNVHTLTTAIVLLQISYWIYAKWSPKIINTMIHLGVVSFGVYLFHPFILYYYRMIEFGGNPVVYHLSVVGGFLSALLGSWIVVGLTMRYLKWSWWIFGAIPRSMPYMKKREEVKKEVA
ncbi:acyltransferase [Anaerobacillus alkaliphilus]|uniref:Acyltransferase n=1 Tax=Anaerobacillus alkaliphilus TaxID=1548597 RepID=A0A4Q0VX37_9BACI|nr:acyltransferase [Anaerobacillus alkaliphilus]RXJ02950.1 acyltransferase [Anaerobacillus alkaliphilus]